MTVAVGIDLGTTNSCVAVVQGDQARIVESVYGDRLHPSVISFLPDGRSIAGPLARQRLSIDPLNTVYSFKRLLGQDLSLPEIRHHVESLPYDVYDKNGIPVLKTRDRESTLPEISAILLRYLREMISETYGMDIRDAIITVPANFTDVQRASTKIAGRIAGFNVLRILNEPTAAALAYGFGSDREERIAVYDFGGGTFDITIIEMVDDIFEVLSTAGDNFLGGDDLDRKIMDDMLAQFEKKHHFDLHEDPIALQRVRSVAERAKCQLSVIEEVNATLRDLATDRRGRTMDFTFSITRRRFNELADSLVGRTIDVCEEALQLAKLSARDLDNVVMVGGSTRVPMVRERVGAFFGREPRIEVNPDEVVAIGAAINAFSLTEEALDPGIQPRRRERDLNDPFGLEPEKPEPTIPGGPMSTSAGLAQAVRKSTIPPPAPGFRQLDDPFSDKAGSRGLSIDDPFSRPVAKVGLEKRNLKSSEVDLPALVDETMARATDLPVPVAESRATDADLPALKEDTWDMDLPVPKSDQEPLELETASESLYSMNLDITDDQPEIIEMTSVSQDDPPLEMPPAFAMTLEGDELSAEASEPSDFQDIDLEVTSFPSVPPPPGDIDVSVATLPPMFPSVGTDIPKQPTENVVLISATKPLERPDITMAGPFQSHGHHPMDQVTGEDGHAVETNQHEAFVVPVKKAATAVLLDVTPRGLGVATTGGYCDIIIERNAAIPVEQSRRFSTSRDNQTDVIIEVYQGESRKTSENTLLGKIELTDLRAAPRGAISILVTFEIDTDGLLNLKAVNEETAEVHSTTIRLTGGLQDDQVSALLEKYADHDKG